MKKIKEALKDKKLYFFFIITLLFFGMFAKMDFATDTYAVIGNDKSEILANFLQSGRFITAFFFAIFKMMNIKISIVYVLSFTLSVISISMAMYIIDKILLKEKANRVLAGVASVLLIINPFSIEEMMYIEKGIMTLAILLTVLAVKYFVDYMDDNKKASIVKSMLFMLFSVMCYQGVVGLFVIISAVFTILKSKNFKEFIKNTFIMLMIYAAPAFVDLLLIKAFSSTSRVSGKIDIAESSKKIVDGSKKMIQTYQILPTNTFIFFNVLAVILIIISSIKSKKTDRESIFKTIISILYIILVDYVFAILPQAMQKTDSIWFVARSTYPFTSMLGAIITYEALKRSRAGNAINCNNENNNIKNSSIKSNNIESRNIENSDIENDKKQFSASNEKMNKILAAIGIVFLGIQLVRFYEIEINHYTVNYLDKEISKSVGQEIIKYENETGNKVTKISVYKDKNPRYSYNDLFVVGDINITAFATEWSDANAINYYNKLELKKVENDKNIKEKFESVDYTSFSKKQIIIKDDTVHLCVF